MEPSVHLRETNMKPSMHFRKANTDPSVHFRKANAKFVLLVLLPTLFTISLPKGNKILLSLGQILMQTIVAAIFFENFYCIYFFFLFVSKLSAPSSAVPCYPLLLLLLPVLISI